MQRILERSMLSFLSKNQVKHGNKVNEQSESRPSSSDTVIDFVTQSKSRPSASTSLAKSQFTHVAESETWYVYSQPSIIWTLLFPMIMPRLDVIPDQRAGMGTVWPLHLYDVW